jgi:hypothetical protein
MYSSYFVQLITRSPICQAKKAKILEKIEGDTRVLQKGPYEGFRARHRRQGDPHCRQQRIEMQRTGAHVLNRNAAEVIFLLKSMLLVQELVSL